VSSPAAAAEAAAAAAADALSPTSTNYVAMATSDAAAAAPVASVITTDVIWGSVGLYDAHISDELRPVDEFCYKGAARVQQSMIFQGHRRTAETGSRHATLWFVFEWQPAGLISGEQSRKQTTDRSFIAEIISELRPAE